MNKITTILFGSILAISLFTQLLPDHSFSELENRYLQTMPKLTWSSLVSGQFTSRFETYIQDHFIARDIWMKGKTHLVDLIGKNQTNGVYPLDSGKYLEVDEGPDDKQVHDNIQVLQNFTLWLQNQGIPSEFLAIYSGYEFSREQLPNYHLNYNQRDVTEKILQLPHVSLIDTYANLLAHKDESIYFDTDHHWTQLGAYYAYEEIAKQKGWDVVPIQTFIRKQSAASFYGTLYSKAPRFGVKGDVFTYYIDPINTFILSIPEIKYTQEGLYKEDDLQKKDQYTAFLGGNNGLVVIERQSAESQGRQETQNIDQTRTLLMFKDSYSHALVPFLAQHYDKIVMVDMRYYNGVVRELVTQTNPSEVMFAYNLSWFGNDQTLKKWN